MRLERIGLSLCVAALLAGCVTTHPAAADRGGVPDKVPHASKAEQKQEAARIHTELAQRYMQNGNLQDALTTLNKALDFDADYVPAHTVIAVLYERINDLPHAEQHYRRAVALSPTKGDVNNNLGRFLCEKEGKTAEGIEYLQKALADPFYQTPAMAWTNMGKCSVRVHDYAAGEADFRRALNLDSTHAEALYQLANALYLQNDAPRARAFIQRYDALGQSNPLALKLGYDIETQLGNRDAALDYSRRLNSQFPDSEQARALNPVTGISHDISTAP